MATAPEKIDKKTTTGKNGKEVVAEPAKTTEADGYSPDTKVQKTAKAEMPAANDANAITNGNYQGLDTETLIGFTARCICRGGSTIKRSSSRDKTRYFSRSRGPATRQCSSAPLSR